MDYTKRMGTTTRPPIRSGLHKEFRMEYLRGIKDKIEKFNIPPELVLNAGLTPSSYISVAMAKSGPIKGLTDKRNITLTFGW